MLAERGIFRRVAILRRFRLTCLDANETDVEYVLARVRPDCELIWISVRSNRFATLATLWDLLGAVTFLEAVCAPLKFVPAIVASIDLLLAHVASLDRAEEDRIDPILVLQRQLGEARLTEGPAGRPQTRAPWWPRC